MQNNEYKILEASNLSIGYVNGRIEQKIVNEINFSVNQPKLISIIGKNGSGKSTFLRSIGRLQQSLSGEIKIDNQLINSISQNEWVKNVGIVLTETSKETNFTVYEMVALGRTIYTNWLNVLTEKDKGVILWAIQELKIEDLLHKSFNQLSDGQRQKVVLARVLAQNTPLIMLDEPTVHLDVQHTMELFQFFRNLVAHHHKTLFLTTHEIGLATRFSDEIWIIDKGKLMIHTKENIIKNNIIDQFFNSDMIKFNTENFNFEYKK